MIKVNMVKAKEISHEVRRAKRAEEFAPLDIKATIPGEAEQAELDRQAIRDKHAVAQIDINAATTPEALKAILEAL